MAALDPVLQPYQLKDLRLKNRVMSTAHAPSYVEDGKPKQRYRLYHEEKAKGGLALTMFGGSTTTAPDSPSAFGQINAASDAIIPWFQELADAVHRHDCALMCQITHMGRRTCDDVADWLPTLAPSPVRERQHRSFPKTIELHEIKRVLAGYAAGARRCKEGGLDGVEVIAWGHLVDQFLSPALNRRTDAYGGSLENRCRFALEVFGAIREAVGPDYIVGIRLTGDEHVRARPRPGRVRGDRAPAGGERADRLLQRGRGRPRYRRAGRLHHPQHGQPLRPVPRARRPHPQGHRPAGVPGVAHPGSVDRALGGRAGLMSTWSA